VEPKEAYGEILNLLPTIVGSKDLELKFELLRLIRVELNAAIKQVEAEKETAPIDLAKLTRYLICDAVTGKVIGKYEDGVLKPT
jgi:hypothetical protein